MRISLLLLPLLAISAEANRGRGFVRPMPTVRPLALPAMPAASALRMPQDARVDLAPVMPQAAVIEPLAAIDGPLANIDAVRPAAEVAAAIQTAMPGAEMAASLNSMYFGRRDTGFTTEPTVGGRQDAWRSTVFVVNDEGVQINGRAAEYYQEVRRMVSQYKGRIDLAESLDVMDDTYSDVRSKLSTIEAIARQRGVDQTNTHLEETLLWVDGYLRDNGKNVAIHTHQVFFHHANNRESEIAEGNRRVDKYLEKEAIEYFAPGGKAEASFGKLDEVVLAFDARGYAEIKDHIKAKEAEFTQRFGKRFRFVFTDELGRVPKDKQAVRDELNRLVKKYKSKGLQKIIEGVIYSRYVGVLLELKTVEHFYKLGYDILQSGRDLFDENGHYVTELDTVVRNPLNGQLSIVEAKSARVKLPREEVLRDKVLYKLDTYKRKQALIEKSLGGKFDVVFSLDVGSYQSLAKYLKRQEKELSEKYGFKVSFIFVSSSPDQ